MGEFNFKLITEYCHVVIELKGSDTRTTLVNISQCSKWVDEYYQMNKIPKGVVIPNQFRLKPYPK